MPQPKTARTVTNTSDSACVDFLHWALPPLQMRWPGFRRVRGQVCKHLAQRLHQLGLADFASYRAYIETEPAEWHIVDACCRVTITRFYRDRRVFETLCREILPPLAIAAGGEGRALRAWSIGCASGEEPYTLAILWQALFSDRFPSVPLEILATDTDPRLITRAERACYPHSAVKNLPAALFDTAFRPEGEAYCLRPKYRHLVHFHQQDIRHLQPEGVFDLILCRNLVFTYFDEALQLALLPLLHARLRPGGWLLLGVHEQLPPAQHGFEVVSARLGLYRRC